MTTTTMFFVMLGAAVVTAALMKLIAWLDTPRKAVRRAARPSSVSVSLDFPAVEVYGAALERACRAA